MQTYASITHFWRIKFALAFWEPAELFFKDTYWSKWRESAFPVISALLLQVSQKLFMKRKRNDTANREGTSTVRAEPRNRGTGSTVRDLYVENRKDPLSTRAAHPAFWGHAINKATVGPPVLLSLAICCLSWLLHCQVPALTLSSFTDWCYKSTLWLQHAGDCLPPVQFGNGTPEPLGLLVN